MESCSKKPTDNVASISFCTELEANRASPGGASHNSIRHGRETAEIAHRSSVQCFKPGLHIVVKSVQSTLSHLASNSVPRATFTRFLVEHGLFQYYS